MPLLPPPGGPEGAVELPDGYTVRVYAHGGIDVKLDNGNYASVATTPTSCAALAKLIFEASFSTWRAERGLNNGSLKIYVATGSSERETADTHMNVLREYGYDVTHDWTQWDSDDCSDTELIEQARFDFQGVMCADLLWYIAPKNLSEGSSFELGAAHTAGKRIIVSGELGSNRIFPRLAHHIFPLHSEALEFLRVRGWQT